jgi:hypothetical protein
MSDLVNEALSFFESHPEPIVKAAQTEFDDADLENLS